MLTFHLKNKTTRRAKCEKQNKSDYDACFLFHGESETNMHITSAYLTMFLFDLILYVPVNNFSFMLGRVFLG